ncbi:hypothetical protein HMPREF0454_00502 [Hafnia alvei ATCC 51873]|uniref:Uncharacterized protein n=1 Tax=Hafnia alvei ATCC 51873 TaxID=1002364 RepID=G9Y1T5_HAFAL|nr:hypothetical protein HMPREF0454_00502 [Hafnia alvei ATCC 51873]
MDADGDLNKIYLLLTKRLQACKRFRSLCALFSELYVDGKNKPTKKTAHGDVLMFR